MVDWHKPEDRLPDDGQVCMILSKHSNAAIAAIVFKSTGGWEGVWVDLFAMPEAGAMYAPDVVWAWCDWDEIKPSFEE